MSRVTFFILQARTETASAQTNRIIRYGQDLEIMMVNGSGRQKLGQGRNCWQWVKYAWQYSDLLQVLKGERWSALASQQGGA